MTNIIAEFAQDMPQTSFDNCHKHLLYSCVNPSMSLQNETAFFANHASKYIETRSGWLTRVVDTCCTKRNRGAEKPEAQRQDLSYHTVHVLRTDPTFSPWYESRPHASRNSSKKKRVPGAEGGATGEGPRSGPRL